MLGDLRGKPEQLKRTPAQRAADAAKRARENLRKQQQQAVATQRTGGLAGNSLFADEQTEDAEATNEELDMVKTNVPLTQRSTKNMALALNPRPTARSRWQRRMVIRSVRHGGRLTKQMKINRSERSHTAKSHFFKTSMKKLAPLARQIAGKSIDEAILQMRFSRKKVAREVRQHLIQARDEAVVIKGMGLKHAAGDVGQVQAETQQAKPAADHIIVDPGITPPQPGQTPTKSSKDGAKRNETDIYVAQAWTNQGPYGQEPDYRARGRINIMRPPWTGLSVLLKEEKTRTRQKVEKEAKEIRKRLGKSMWTQLPDRKVVKQSQYVLW